MSSFPQRSRDTSVSSLLWSQAHLAFASRSFRGPTCSWVEGEAHRKPWLFSEPLHPLGPGGKSHVKDC